MKRILIKYPHKVEKYYHDYLTKLLKKVRKRNHTFLKDSVDLNLLIQDYKNNLANLSDNDIVSFLNLLSKKILDNVTLNIGINTEEETKILQTFLDNNILLIKSLLNDEYKKLHKILSSAIIEGYSIDKIKNDLINTFQFSNNRAETIAISETANINSQLNRNRMKKYNINNAFWSSAKDKRVRRCHLARDGKEFNINKGCYASCDGRFLQVGMEVRCRCAMVIFI